MRIPSYIPPLLLFFLFFTLADKLSAQYKIKGTVYDSTRSYPLERVTVMSSSGSGTMTNNDGEYVIEVSEQDSIWFSYLNKPTMKFPVLKILTPYDFDISLQVNVPVLKEVKIRPRDYKLDSMQNRQDYAKIFNYKKPGLSPSVTNMGVGFDLNEIINMFRFRRNKSMLAFQKRLLFEEQDKAVTHRFNKGLVRRLTGLTGDGLDSFMIIFRPSFRFTKMAGEYEFQLYIKESYNRYLRGLGPAPLLRLQEDEEQ
jgi:hypothetical protein